ncbi:hypothetical protein B0H13DRAFT_2056060, partial [Mycena leptocephala]
YASRGDIFIITMRRDSSSAWAALLGLAYVTLKLAGASLMPLRRVRWCDIPMSAQQSGEVRKKYLHYCGFFRDPGFGYAVCGEVTGFTAKERVKYVY